MQIPRLRFLRLTVLIFITNVLALSAQAAGFNNASLKGGYSFLINKWIADVNANQEADVGVMTFDGVGNVTASITSMQGGVVQIGAASGTYTVNSNGTGAINFTTGGATPPHFAVILTSTAAGLAHGVQLLMTNENSNVVDSGGAFLQSTSAATYTLASIKGNLTFQLNKWTADVNETREGIVGILSFDGAGKVKGSFTDMVGGVLKTGTATGTYAVNSDGTGSISLITGTDTPHLAFALNSVAAGRAKGLQLLQTNTSGNKVISGAALKQ